MVNREDGDERETWFLAFPFKPITISCLISGQQQDSTLADSRQPPDARREED